MKKAREFSISRRGALAIGGAGILASSSHTLAAVHALSAVKESYVRPSRAPRRDSLSTPANAIVATSGGPVRGYVEGDTFIFKGVPYGADTGGENRFMPPQPPRRWTEPKLCVNYGPICPQVEQLREQNAMSLIIWADTRYQSEDCLNLNVWTTSTSKAAKLPVLVWMHGGGFTAGSSHEHLGYDGLNLARRGAVVVTVTHRLGVFGYMDLSEAGDAFASSGNVGMLDLVAALQWIKENIEQFGGDASRVTIFGQSGGGAKVSTLMAMPAARGLFHRAVVMSGSPSAFASPDQTRPVARMTAEAAGVAVTDVPALQKLSSRALLEASGRAEAGAPHEGRRGFQPVLNSVDLPEDWSKGAPTTAKGVPLIVGNTRDEFRPLAPRAALQQKEITDQFQQRFGEKANAVLSSLSKSFPALKPIDLAIASSALNWRENAVVQAGKQAANGTPVYLYWFVHSSPLFEGGLGAPHGAEVDMFFDNPDKQPGLTGYRAEAYNIAELLSGMLVAFAATGTPQYGRVPWTQYDIGRVNTMVFDTVSEMVDDPAGDARRIAASTPRTPPFG